MSLVLVVPVGQALPDHAPERVASVRVRQGVPALVTPSPPLELPCEHQ